jgi:HEPN domain-containing protein
MVKNKTLDRLIETIVEDCRPEKIFLVSHFQREEQFSHPALNVEPASNKITKYDLLVLINSDRDLEQLSTFIESRTSIIARVTAMAYSMDDFNRLLEYGHPFVKKLMASDCLVFDAETVEFGYEDSIDQSCMPGMSGQDGMNKALDNAEEFFAAANLHFVRKHFEIAVFNLHQCAEQLYMAALQKGTGLKFITNDILRLQNYTLWFSKEIRDILYSDPSCELHLGKMLQQAFYHSRYNAAYSLNDKKFALLAGEVRKLFDFTVKLCTKSTG